MPFSIKDISNLSGIKAHTIRMWEQRYSFIKPSRTGTNIRFYSNEELQTILNISLLNKYGYKISHISKMSEQVMADKIFALPDLNANQEKIINDLIKKMVDLDMIQFEEIINLYISNNGIEKTILKILFPFLERIGILWLTYNINPGQEHLVSNLIKQKIFVGIDNLKNKKENHRSVCLFLPEGEYHELGLLYIYYLLKKKEISVIYLGANISLDDVDFVVKLKKPEILFVHITVGIQPSNFQKLLNKFSKRFTGITTVVSGNPVSSYKNKTPNNINLKRSLNEIIEFIENF